MEERRRVERTRVLKGAKIVFIGRSLGLDCVVHNLTNSGACLHGARMNEAPASFQLTFDGGRTWRSCRKVWSREGRLGASFEKGARGDRVGR
jgi:hypothetical protein